MSSFSTSHCELCKKVVEQEDLSTDHEGFEVCRSCKQKGIGEAYKELDDSCSGFCEACGIHTDSLQDCSDPAIGPDAAIYSACPSCTLHMRNKCSF